MSPTTTSSREACVEYTQESLTEQQIADDFDYDDITIGQTLLTVCRRRADQKVVCRDTSHEQVHEIQRQNSESDQIRTLLDRQREQILADCEAEIRKHEFQADYDRRSIQKLSETIESQKEEIYRAHQGDEQLLKQNCDLREAHEKSLNEMEELKRFQGSTFDTFARRRLVADQDTILELTGKIQELQNEINCTNDSIDFQDAESVRSGHSHVAVNQRFSHLFKILANAKPFSGCQAAPAFGTRMVYRETFLQFQRRLLQHFIRKSRIRGSLMYQKIHHHL